MKRYIIILVVSSFVMTTIANAYLVFGNYDGINVSSSGGGVGYLSGHNGNPAGTRWLSYLSWGGGEILVESIEIYAQMYAGSSDNIHMYLYDNGELIATLEPDEIIGAAGNYMFSPTAPLILDAGLGLYDLVIEPDFVEGTWMAWSYSITASGGDYSEAVGTTWGAWEPAFDAPTYRVHYEVVPEPSTIALFLLGFSCIIARKKRKS